MVKSSKPSTHPFVKAYIRIADILEAAETLQKPYEAVVEALVQVAQFDRGQCTAKDALRCAEAVDISTISDPQLAAIFLWQWARVCANTHRTDEGLVLLNRAQSLIGPDTPVGVEYGVRFTKGHILSRRGDQRPRERVFRQIRKHLPRNSPFYAPLMRLVAYNWVNLGRGEDLREEIDYLGRLKDRSIIATSVPALRFCNCIETGQWAEARRHQETIMQASLVFEHSHTADATRIYSMLLALVEDGWVPGDPLPIVSLLREAPSLGPDFSDLDAPWARSLHFLLVNEPEKALAEARISAIRHDNFSATLGFRSYTLIRAELAAGNADAALRILHQRRAVGNANYMDDFFLAHAAILMGEVESAGEHLATLFDSAEHYRAHGRVDLEFRLACQARRDLVMRATEAATRQRSRRRASSSSATLPTDGAHGPGEEHTMVGGSPAMTFIRETIRRFAPLDVPVLITGETGTGKELVARNLHLQSPRKDKPFVPLNCGAISESLLESELFGHERGAFSGAEKGRPGLFAEAGEGTIFLDEIGDVSPRFQVALLRVLESNEFRAVGGNRVRKSRCRVIAATNADLEALSGNGRFRQDLLYRLRRLEIRIPPLREHVEDIVPLATAFLNQGRASDATGSMSPDLMDALEANPWAGNVRELRNVIEQMRLLNSDKLDYDAADLAASLAGAATQTVRESVVRAPAVATPDTSSTPFEKPLRKGRTAIRRLEELRTLFKEHGILTRAEVAEALGVAPNTATQDLKNLCAEGFVRKVCPSASSRSHYFELTGH